LAPAGEAEGDLVLQVDPGISVFKPDGRLKLRLDFTAQGLLYANNPDANTINLNNDLLAFATAELYQNHLFLDVYGSISQVATTSGGRVDAGNVGFGGGGRSGGALGLLNWSFDVLPGAADIFNPVGIFGNIALTDDGDNQLTTEASFGISPYWRQNFGGWAEALLRDRYSDVIYGQSEFDSQIKAVEFSLTSGRQFGRLGWSLAYFNQRQNGQQDSNQEEGNNTRGGGNNQQESATGELNYQLSDAWKLLAQGGYENNTGFTDNENGTYWGLGATWSPNRFYSLTGLYGYNFNEIALQWNPSARTSLQLSRSYQGIGTSPGTYWNGSLNYKTRYTTWSADYTQEVTTNQELLSNSLTGLDPDGQPVILDENGQVFIPSGPFGLTNQPFLRKYFNTSITYRRGRNALGFSLFSENRTFQDSDPDESAYGIGGLWTWRFAPRTASFLGTGWERDELSEDQQNDYWVSVMGLARVFTPDSGGLISYRYYRNDAEPADQGFRENRLNLRFSMKF
jgi:uncharacterized protein (PEP-CTERM system associated)